jgi:hypothetical protein
MQQPESGELKAVSLGARKAIQMSLAPPAVLALLLIVLVWKFPALNVLSVPEGALFAACFGVAGLYLVLTFFTWRCPSCRAYLGRDRNPQGCPACGVRFTESAGER